MAATDRPRPPSVDRICVRSFGPRGSSRRSPVARPSVRDVLDEERARLARRARPPADALADAVLDRLEHLDGPDLDDPAACDQRDRGHPPHEPWARAPGRRRDRGSRRPWRPPSPRCSSSTRRPADAGTRFRAAEDDLVALTGAEDALVMNNNAAALALAVGLAGRRGVVVSRGELVEIGGGVRIPESCWHGGCAVDRGRDDESDPSRRLRGRPRQGGEGRPARPPVELRRGRVWEAPDAAKSRPSRIAMARSSSTTWVRGAPGHRALRARPRADAVRATDAGSDLVTLSGDKLVGGPQAGHIAGRRNSWPGSAGPTRPRDAADKAILAGVAATLASTGRAGCRRIPVWRLIALEPGALRLRAESICP